MYDKILDEGTKKLELQTQNIVLDIDKYFTERFTMLDYFVSLPEIRGMDSEVQGEFFQDVMTNNHFVTDPFIGPNNAPPIATLSKIIYSKEGEVLGALCGVIQLQQIYTDVLKKRDEKMYEFKEAMKAREQRGVKREDRSTVWITRIKENG